MASPRDRGAVLAALGEVFREHGFDGASLALISARTGLGKGSLYHAFPGGKEEMAAAVLAEIDLWFATHVFRPLKGDKDSRRAIAHMLQAVDAYFRAGRRLCLVGILALGDARDRFGQQVSAYFLAWREALADALVRMGHGHDDALSLAEDTVAAIQGALILARAVPETGTFTRMLARLETRLLAEPK